MIRQVEAAQPAYVVYVSIRSSWQPHPDVDRRLLDWSQAYASKCYDLVGVTDIHSPSETAYVWGAAARTYRPKSESLVYTFRRKSSAPCSAGEA